MEKNTELSQWLKLNLEEVLPCLVSDDIVEYIMNIEDIRDFEEYMNTLTDVSSPKYQEFLAKYKKIRCVKDKTENIDEKYVVKPKQKKKGNSENNSKDKKSGDTKETQKQGQKKKTKYINLFSSEGKQKDIILLKGRHLCECQATKHKLINNCLKCGRIVCEQEGSGPCLFCSNEVFSRKELELINSNTKKSRKLYNALMDSVKFEEVDKAVEARDKLLEFDRTYAQRTQVIDDESEYYSSNSVWLSKEEREKLEKKEKEAHEKKHASRLEKKFTLDIAGLTVYEDEPKEIDESSQEEVANKIETVLSERYVHPDISDLIEIKYESTDSQDKGKNFKKKEEENFLELNEEMMCHVQDQELLEMHDVGTCLTVHQPWASLLVTGIMRFEGRTWYTSHRGRLWIAAASKKPTKEEIEDAEKFFKTVRADEKLVFPKTYPTGCLLGCVSIVDCLPEEEFRAKFPNGECDSPFVFICEDPRRLDTLFPVSGSHKLYKLDPRINIAANKILIRMGRNS